MPLTTEPLFSVPRISWLLPTLLGLGGLVRGAVWLQNRSLFIDEANLARNIAEKSWADFFHPPLAYDQFAPPLFLLLQKCSLLAFGANEWALRLVPMLASLLALCLFVKVLRHFSSDGAVQWFPVFVLAFSTFFVRYSTEVKQYSTDLTVALGLIWMALALQMRQRPTIWAVAGALSIWFSMPAVFVLCGVGAYALSQAWRDFQTAKTSAGKTSPPGIAVHLAPLAFVFAAWMGSFALNFWLILKPGIADPHLQSSHREFFAPLLPRSLEDWTILKNLLLSIPYYTAGYTVLAMLVGSLGLLAGLFVVIKNRQREALLLGLPMLACLVASACGFYSLMPRLLLWFFPLALLLQSVGYQFVASTIKSKWPKAMRFSQVAEMNAGQCVFLAILIATASLNQAWKYLWKPYQIEEIRTVLAEIKRVSKPGDLLLVTQEAMPATQFYVHLHEARAEFSPAATTVFVPWDFEPSTSFFEKNTTGSGRVWLVYSHLISPQSLADMQADLSKMHNLGVLEQEVSAEGARGFCFLISVQVH